MSRLEYIHDKTFLHRDVKPDNFLIGNGKKQHVIYAIDFGLAKRFKDPKTWKHIPYRDDKNLTGTARYASLSTHLGIEQSRRDDLECLANVLIYFMRGSLPWQGLPAKDRKEKYEKIKQKKQTTTIEMLCEGFPEEFVKFFKYCRSLKFDDTPKYIQLRKMFKDLFDAQGYVLDNEFDWDPKIKAAREENAKFLAGLPPSLHMLHLSR